MYNYQNTLVAKAAAPKDTHPILSNVLFLTDRTVATNSYMLAQMTTQSEGSGITKQIPANMVKVLSKAGEPITEETIEALPYVPSGKFPPFEQIIPTDEPSAYITLNVDYLKTLVDIASKMDAKRGEVTLELHGPRAPMCIYAETEEGQVFTGLVMPIVKDRCFTKEKQFETATEVPF